ncbi:MAG TPA: hypothetical protein VGM90_30420 [Kofleriaceae bacterium]
MRTSLAAVLFASSLAACGGGGGGSNGPDARPIGDVGPVTCTAPNAFGQPTLSMTDSQHSGPDTDGSEKLEFFGLLNSDPLPDSLYLSFFNGYAPFDPDIMPTTVTLTGDQADYATCGACVEIDTDLSDAGDLTDIYFVNGGTLNITSTTTNLTGTIMNASFVHSIIDNDTLETTPSPDGCVTSIASVSFTAAITQADDTGGSGSGSANLARVGGSHGRRGGTRLKLQLH